MRYASLRHLPVLMVLIACCTLFLSATKPGIKPVSGNVSVNEDAIVLQKLVDHSALQQFYPKNGDGSYKPLHVMQHSIAFPSNLNVSHAGKALEFIDKGLAMSGTIEGYFLFHQFEVSVTKAWIECAYYYDQTTATPKMQAITIEMEKSGSAWNITKSQIEGRNP